MLQAKDSGAANAGTGASALSMTPGHWHAAAPRLWLQEASRRLSGVNVDNNANEWSAIAALKELHLRKPANCDLLLCSA
jgi:hypothetical protein